MKSPFFFGFSFFERNNGFPPTPSYSFSGSRTCARAPTFALPGNYHAACFECTAQVCSPVLANVSERNALEGVPTEECHLSQGARIPANLDTMTCAKISSNHVVAFQLAEAGLIAHWGELSVQQASAAGKAASHSNRHTLYRDRWWH
jgi:hypothetical protein